MVSAINALVDLKLYVSIWLGILDVMNYFMISFRTFKVTSYSYFSCLYYVIFVYLHAFKGLFKICIHCTKKLCVCIANVKILKSGNFVSISYSILIKRDHGFL